MRYAAKAPRLLVAGEIDEGAVAYIAENVGIKQAGWREELQVQTANSHEMDFCSLKFLRNGLPRATRCDTGHRVCYADSH